jgi:hypothetical protein
MEKTEKKRRIIIAIFITTFVGIIFLLLQGFKAAPSCFDGIKNQDEKNIDCGGICEKNCLLVTKENLVVRYAGHVESGIANKYDVYGKVANPNNQLGSNKFNYEFKIKNAAGDIVAKRSGTSFILSGDEKYVIETNVETEDIPVSVELEIGNTEWIEDDSYLEKPTLKIVNKDYSEISSGVNFSEATGLLKNESQFDFSSIKLRILLKDKTGEIIAINSTQISTVKAGENRGFRVVWPGRFSGNVGNMEVQTEVDVFDPETFLKKYFQSEKFQELQ